MKRTKAIALFACLTALISGYVVWCWRSFLLGVAEPELIELPKEFRGEALEEIRKSGMLGPMDFDRKWAMELLVHPYDCAPPEIEVTTPEEHLVFVSRDGWNSVIFTNYGLNQGWRIVPDDQKIP
jgi:hypothetical protein